jgi:hypothetical protein
MPERCCRCGRPAELPSRKGGPHARRALCRACEEVAAAAYQEICAAFKDAAEVLTSAQALLPRPDGPTATAFGDAAAALTRGWERAVKALADYLEALERLPPGGGAPPRCELTCRPGKPPRRRT